MLYIFSYYTDIPFGKNKDNRAKYNSFIENSIMDKFENNCILFSDYTWFIKSDLSVEEINVYFKKIIKNKADYLLIDISDNLIYGQFFETIYNRIVKDMWF